MIVYSMNKDELLSEVSAEVDWVDGMIGGIEKKYSKQMKQKTDGILGITSYISPRNNKIWVIWNKEFNGKNCTIVNSIFIEYASRYNTRNVLMPIFGESIGYCVGVLEFTQHSFDRLKERAGLDFIGFLKVAERQGFKFSEQTYVYNGIETDAYSLSNTGLFLLDKTDWGTIAKTFVSTNYLGSNQLETLLDSKRDAEIFDRISRNKFERDLFNN